MTERDDTLPEGGNLPDLGPGSNPEKDPDTWTTGDEPMTGPQRSYLSTLAREAELTISDDLTKAEASKLIDELQERTGRGATTTPG
jgi:hypothetical protein